MAEYLGVEKQDVVLNAPIIFNASIPCSCGNVYHEDGTGVFILKGPLNGQCFAKYQVTFNGNIAVPAGATPTPIAIAISICGETRPSSLAIFTPASSENFGNVTSTAIIKVPRGCCFQLSVDSVPATTDPSVTPAQVIEVQNANLVITRG